MRTLTDKHNHRILDAQRGVSTILHAITFVNTLVRKHFHGHSYARAILWTFSRMLKAPARPPTCARACTQTRPRKRVGLSIHARRAILPDVQTCLCMHAYLPSQARTPVHPCAQTYFPKCGDLPIYARRPVFPDAQTCRSMCAAITLSNMQTCLSMRADLPCKMCRPAHSCVQT